METIKLREGDCHLVNGETVCVAIARGGKLTLYLARHELETRAFLEQKARQEQQRHKYRGLMDPGGHP